MIKVQEAEKLFSYTLSRLRVSQTRSASLEYWLHTPAAHFPCCIYTPHTDTLTLWSFTKPLFGSLSVSLLPVLLVSLVLSLSLWSSPCFGCLTVCLSGLRLSFCLSDDSLGLPLLVLFTGLFDFLVFVPYLSLHLGPPLPPLCVLGFCCCTFVLFIY